MRFASYVLSLTPETSAEFLDSLPPDWLPRLAKFPPYTLHLLACYVGAGYKVVQPSTTSHNPIHPVLCHVNDLMSKLDTAGIFPLLTRMAALSDVSIMARLQELIWCDELRVALGALTLALRLKGHLSDDISVTQATQIVIHNPSADQTTLDAKPAPITISLPDRSSE